MRVIFACVLVACCNGELCLICNGKDFTVCRHILQVIGDNFFKEGDLDTLRYLK